MAAKTMPTLAYVERTLRTLDAHRDVERRWLQRRAGVSPAPSLVRVGEDVDRRDACPTLRFVAKMESLEIFITLARLFSVSFTPGNTAQEQARRNARDCALQLACQPA